VGNVGAGHVAGNQNRVRIVGADGGVEHRPAATGPDDTKITWTLRNSEGQAHCGKDEKKKRTFHWLLPDLACRTFRDIFTPFAPEPESGRLSNCE